MFSSRFAVVPLETVSGKNQAIKKEVDMSAVGF